MPTDVQDIPTLLFKPSALMYNQETGQQITEKYLKIIIKKPGHVCQRDITQYKLALRDQIQEMPFLSFR